MKFINRIGFGFLFFIITLLSGCWSAPPELTGFAVNTPYLYSENKMFYTELPTTQPAQILPLEHVYHTDSSKRVSLKSGDPIAVILKSVRLPEDLPGGTHDIAIVLDVNTTASKDLTEFVAFYQRDVPAGQRLNFADLVVYSDSNWDSRTPPYFRVRILDVKAERNNRIRPVLESLTQFSGEIAGVSPHPIIPIVQKAIEAAASILSNQSNKVLLDFQVNLYGQEAAENAGDATLTRLFAGQWLVLGRQREKDSEFWNTALALDQNTDRIVDLPSRANVPVPYITLVIDRFDLQAPKYVMDRSATMIQLLSSPAGKSDTDALSAAATSLMSGAKVYVDERSLLRYHTTLAMKNIMDQLSAQNTANQSKSTPPLSEGDSAELVRLVNKVANKDFGAVKDAAEWWAGGGDKGQFQPIGTDYIWVVPSEQGSTTHPSTVAPSIPTP